MSAALKREARLDAAYDRLHGLCPGGPIGADPAATCPICNMSRLTLDAAAIALAEGRDTLTPEPETAQRELLDRLMAFRRTLANQDEEDVGAAIDMLMGYEVRFYHERTAHDTTALKLEAQSAKIRRLRESLMLPHYGGAAGPQTGMVLVTSVWYENVKRLVGEEAP